ncbi:uncharacterized protein LOC131674205 [Phymastichus coffea]|uniref:uncharacterized protein LOC131674205 n=1 Tax=Phymastichus coffea TaxID=108790 RepID=UPI00273C239F|nr:uncharacterized protein LOC131674205 [Phymastichus coffea]
MSGSVKLAKSVTLKSKKSKNSCEKTKSIKGLKPDCLRATKSVKSEKLIGVTDIDGENETCAVPKITRPYRPKWNKCANQSQWDCKNDSLWRSYMKTLTADASKRIAEQREAKCLYPDRKRKQFDVPCLPCPPKLSFRYELNALNQGRRIIDVLGPTTAGVWDSLRDPRSCIDSSSVASSEFDWPRLYPCTTRDIVKERKILARRVKMRMLGASPCEVDEIDSPESSEDEMQRELAHQKELGLARIPFTYRKDDDPQLVDRDIGDTPGLVYGDYVIFQLTSQKCGDRTYANVCLRGTTGMHLAELGRAREKTWKFCVFQALVALLAKTQLRYKYVWSANVDYIYNQAWMIFLHVGYLTLRDTQRFDDVLVYNYKYSVELQLVHELKKVRIVQDVTFDYFEKTMKKKRQLRRKEMTLTKSNFSTEKTRDEYGATVHRETRRIEKWFDNLDDVYSNCIFRTSRFTLAFWKDGSFWYLYNPYRCDEFGFWNDDGFACFVKFCSRDSLKRHLVILTLRAYAYECEVQNTDDYYSESVTTKSYASSMGKRKRFTLQIYQLIYHSCHIHNVKLLLREPRKPKPQLIEKKQSELCTFDPLEEVNPCDEPKDDISDVSFFYHCKKNIRMEKFEWLEDEIIWARYPTPAKPRCGPGADKLPKWHNYEIVSSKRLYILWGTKHILQKTFPEENRGKQAATCYAVCAGMCLINAPEFWDAETLDDIVICGDKFYSERYGKLKEVCVKIIKGNLPVDDWDERPTDKFRIGNMTFDLEAKSAIHGRLYFKSNRCLWQTLQRFFQNNTFGVLTCESAQLAVFKHYGVYFMLDVASYGPPIFERGAAMAYLIRATCFVDFMKNLVLVIGAPECCKFTLRPMEIVDTVDLSDVDECGRIRWEKCEEKPVELFKPICPTGNDKKGKKTGTKLAGGTKTFDQTACVERSSKSTCSEIV